MLISLLHRASGGGEGPEIFFLVEFLIFLLLRSTNFKTLSAFFLVEKKGPRRE